MKILTVIVLAACVLLASCESLKNFNEARQGRLVKTAAQSATLYIALEHPELLPYVQAGTDIVTGDQATQEDGLRQAFELYLMHVEAAGLTMREKQHAAAIAAFVDAAGALGDYDIGLVPRFMEFVEATRPSTIPGPERGLK